MVGCWRCHHRSSWHRTQQQDSFKLLSCLFCHGPWSFCGILSRPVNDCSWWIRCGGKYNVLASLVNVVPRHQQVSGRRNKRGPIWAIISYSAVAHRDQHFIVHTHIHSYNSYTQTYREALHDNCVCSVIGLRLSELPAIQTCQGFTSNAL